MAWWSLTFASLTICPVFTGMGSPISPIPKPTNSAAFCASAGIPAAIVAATLYIFGGGIVGSTGGSPYTVNRPCTDICRFACGFV